MINLVKLCVGAKTVQDLIDWQKRYGDGPAEHVTRMWPKRKAEILDGGSLYWVFKGTILARQPILDLRERIDPEGTRRCAIILGRDPVLVTPTPRKAFQGWRYLDPQDAPADLPRGRTPEVPLPPKLARELAELGVI